MTFKADAPSPVVQLHTIDKHAQRRDSLLQALDINLDRLAPKTRVALEAMATELIALRDQKQDLHARLEMAESLADRDPLCEIYNRRAFERELTREIAQAERYGSELCLIFMDLDNFKSVNDHFGHHMGDDVIRYVAGLLVSHLRQTDIVGRLGGDEFGIALTHAGYAQAIQKATLLAGIIDDLQVRGQSAPDTAETVIELGVSCGVVQWQAGIKAETLVAQADEAMFLTKSKRRAGR